MQCGAMQKVFDCRLADAVVDLRAQHSQGQAVCMHPVKRVMHSRTVCLVNNALQPAC